VPGTFFIVPLRGNPSLCVNTADGCVGISAVQALEGVTDEEVHAKTIFPKALGIDENLTGEPVTDQKVWFEKPAANKKSADISIWEALHPCNPRR